MDRIGIIGMSWRDGGPEAIARFTVAKEKRPEWMHRFARLAVVEEVVYLATCNRVEMIFVTDGRTPISNYRLRFFETLTGRRPNPGEAEQAFQTWEEERAAEHLFLITSGLESARVGEVEITGQVRDAFELSRKIGLTGPRLDLLFEEALKVSKRVRNESAIGEGRESLAEIALDHLRERLHRTPGPIAVVGVTEMTERCARTMAQSGVTVCVVNRSLDRSEELARSISGGVALQLDTFRLKPAPVEAVVLATGAPHTVFDYNHLERLAARAPSGEPPLIIDLSIPPDVDVADARRAGVPRIGMKEIIREAEKNRECRLLEAGDARKIVDEALQGLHRRLVDRVLSPLFSALQRSYRTTALEGVERLFKKELEGLGDEEREVVRRWAETLARRFAHLPTAGLRGVAFEMGPSAVEAFLAHADESMVKILRKASHQADVVPFKKEKGAA